ncbi:MAG: T9SS type A sorting domain-containing protein [Bacteroidetes bacterium]|nr:T9SS type A sorting domain-containing protein [Bacteroidota bacterium]
MKRAILSAVFSLLLSYCAARENPFSLQYQADQRIEIDKTFSQSSQIDPFYDASPISGLGITGHVVLNSDSSLIRVILIDDHNNEYLVFESYTLLADSTHFSISQLGEETSLLRQVVPSSLRIEILDASLFLTELVTSKPGLHKSLLSQEDLRKQQMLERINKINDNLRKRNIPWIAGETSLSNMSHEEKKMHFGGKLPDLFGFEYYAGGIFIIPGELKTEDNKAVESPFVKEFSWRNVHGQDWTTPVKNQTGCGSCWAFGSTGAIELMVNLYFNQKIDYDLSEQNVVSCTSGGCDLGAPQSLALEYAKNMGIVPEECFPYTASEQDCSDICANPSDQIRIDSFSYFHKEDAKKRAILSGATSVSVSKWQHVVQVVGYKTLEEGDTLYLKNDSDTCRWITIGNEHPLRNQTAWLCKNSWGENWGDEGYVYLLGDEQDIMMYSLHGPVNSLIYNEESVICTDNDGDGYYSWGIGPKPSHCTDSAPEPDGDDTNRCIGPRDEYGNFTSTTPVPDAADTVIISGQAIPDLFASGENVRWYSDKKLIHPVHLGNLYPTGLEEFGDYTLYATQSLSGCESTANAVTLSIWPEIPSPIGHDTIIKKGEAAWLTAHGYPGAILKWYGDSLLTDPLFTGDEFDAQIQDLGTYTYFVTQTICQNESAPDKVLLRIEDLVSIPDHKFLQALIKEKVDTNNDGIITYPEAEAVTKLNVFRGISDMTGIEAFVNLDTLRCTENFITRLDVSNCHALRYLDCSENRLTSLDVSALTALEYLKCNGFTLTSLDVSGCSALKYLDCSNSQLTVLDVAGCKALQHLNCKYNQMIHLDVSANSALEYLICGRSQLTSLDVSACVNLQQIECQSSQLTSLDVSACVRLQHLDCYYNPLILLDISGCVSLQHLKCSYNQLVRLDFSDCANLQYLNCQDNQLVSLDISDCIALQTLNCSNNQLISLDVSGHTALQQLRCQFNQLSSLDVTDCIALEAISCSENRLVNLDVSNSVKLDYLDCSNNQLISLNASDCSALARIHCFNNQMTWMELSNCTSLYILACSANNLSSLELASCVALKGLYCDNNRFSSLALPESLDLSALYCNNNQLRSLDVSTCPSLRFLNCGSNLLERLDLSNNPEIGSGEYDFPELSITDMPMLNEVCVWTLPFPPGGVNIDTTASPNVEFKDCSIDVEENEPADFLVYPNPSSGIFTVETNIANDYLIEIYTAGGHRIYKETAHGNTHYINLSDFPHGMYLINIRFNSSTLWEKVIKL